MQGKWLVKRTGKLYLKIWRLVEGFMLKGEKEERRKTANYAKVKGRKRGRYSSRDARQFERKKKKDKKLDVCF